MQGLIDKSFVEKLEDLIVDSGLDDGNYVAPVHIVHASHANIDMIKYARSATFLSTAVGFVSCHVTPGRLRLSYHYSPRENSRGC